jgi:lactate racemase
MTGSGQRGVRLDEPAIRDLCAAEIARWDVRDRRVLMIVPDGTRSAPMGVMLRVLHQLLGTQTAAFDVLVALGTHPPMSDAAINARFEITARDRETTYARTKFMNHNWVDPDRLVSLGAITEDEIESLSGGRLREPVDVTINRLALAYDLLLIVGPTFPHEVAGFSGGNKYLFPGISGRDIIDLFHWLGALITNVDIIGVKHTAVRAIVDRAASMVPIERKCVSLVVEDENLVGLYIGSPEEAWSSAADLSSEVNVRHEARAFDSVLSCAPPMYEELWVGGKCAYKVESVVADGGELIIYAPHISRLSLTHGEAIRRIGYHVRDYFVKQAPRFAGIPRGVMAHSTHVKGVGTYEQGVETPRIRVTLATQISEAECRAINLGYRDHRTIDAAHWIGRQHEGRLYVPKAGETLYRLGRQACAPLAGLATDAGVGEGR